MKREVQEVDVARRQAEEHPGMALTKPRLVDRHGEVAEPRQVRRPMQPPEHCR